MLREANVASAAQLALGEKWNQTEYDWQRLLRLHPEGCFAAFASRELIGTITVIVYADTAWLGMMLIAKEHRGKGIGRALLRRALQHCGRNRIRRIGLDATAAGRPLYQRLGFVPFGKVQRWVRPGVSGVSPARRQLIAGDTLQAICNLDEQAFHPSRRALLSLLLEDCTTSPALLRSEAGPLRGYALARPGALGSYLGPIVALESHIALRLLDAVLEQLIGPTFVDVPVDRPDIADRLAVSGFRIQRTLTRMHWGAQPMETSDLVFAIAGPELG